MLKRNDSSTDQENIEPGKDIPPNQNRSFIPNVAIDPISIKCTQAEPKLYVCFVCKVNMLITKLMLANFICTRCYAKK